VGQLLSLQEGKEKRQKAELMVDANRGKKLAEKKTGPGRRRDKKQPARHIARKDKLDLPEKRTGSGPTGGGNQVVVVTKHGVRRTQEKNGPRPTTRCRRKRAHVRGGGETGCAEDAGVEG